MIFHCLQLPTNKPVPSLGGSLMRHRPIVAVQVFGPLGSRVIDGCVDCGCDDTIFSLSVARRLGIDLQGAPQGQAQSVGGPAVAYRYAAVKLQITDGVECYEWLATVGFVDLPLRWALLGHAGFLDFFDTELRGGRREVSLVPAATFPGVMQKVAPAGQT